MNSRELLDLIGQAQDTYVREASGGGYRRLRWVAAACICAVLLSTLVSSFLSGSGLECFLLDAQNGSLPGTALKWAEEASWWNRGSFHSETANPMLTVTFAGKEYTGTYKYSVCPPGQGITKDYYEPENPKEADFDEFGVVSGTGELAYISLLTNTLPEEMEQMPKLENIGQKLEALARQWASEFIDPEKYTFRLVRGGFGVGDVRNYLYEFVRDVDGVDTTDKLTVLLTDRGNLIHIGVGHTGWTEEKRVQLFRFRMANTEKQVAKALEGLQYRIAKQTYGITPKGEVVLLVNCEVRMSNGAGYGVVVMLKETGFWSLLY